MKRLSRTSAVLAALLVSAPAMSADDHKVGLTDEPCIGYQSTPIPGQWLEWFRSTNLQNYGHMCRYAAANAQVQQPVRAVFIGDSITEGWPGNSPKLFSKGIIGRGIGGQTSSQILVRFRQDVIDLRPAAVHIMVGTNDVAGNTGPQKMEWVEGHIHSMADLARKHDIAVIIGSVLPAAAFSWDPGLKPAPQIVELNRRLKAWAEQEGYVFVDYHSAMAAPDGGMKPGLADDGVHPTEAGYRVMEATVRAALAKALP